KFEMFEILAILNATPGAADKVQNAPGALMEVQSEGDSKSADIKRVSGNFGWKEAFKDQYNRVKSAMHEISGLPQIVPQELNFEMFEILAILNATPGAADKVQNAPGALMEVQSEGDSKSADIKRVSGNFGWKEAFKDQYNRVKSAMHEISGLPQIVPQELNFGGLNGEALQVLFHDIITDTEEHWLS